MTQLIKLSFSDFNIALEQTLIISIRKDTAYNYPRPAARVTLATCAHHGVSTSYTMKLRDRYPHLQNPAVVKAMVVRSVYASMALEGQAVPMERLQELYALTEPTQIPNLYGYWRKHA